MTSTDSRKDLRARITRTGIGFLFLIGLMSVALFAAGCGSSSDTGSSTSGTEATAETGEKADSAEPADTADTGEGKTSFTGSCGGCHALKDAGTKGAAGPNLDDLKPDKARVATAITKGGTGAGAMPKNLVSGDKADQVAEYVSSVAGK